MYVNFSIKFQHIYLLSYDFFRAANQKAEILKAQRDVFLVTDFVIRYSPTMIIALGMHLSCPQRFPLIADPQNQSDWLSKVERQMNYFQVYEMNKNYANQLEVFRKNCPQILSLIIDNVLEKKKSDKRKERQRSNQKKKRAKLNNL